ncbi:MAG TPA: hypothetical protein ACFYEK_17600 [Candidatus Wunengus sp. YC60]|uniref:hypothetical protein n=1 Tax=Candidatus Wunengus sp. YC60 TaxID=3367697 RepID=UPI004024FEC6
MVIKMAGRKKKLDLKDTLAKVKECLLLLPGDEEKQKTSQIISEILQELGVLREAINQFPDESKVNNVSGAIQTLVSFFDTIKDKPLLAEMLLPKKTKARKTAVSLVDIDVLLKQLEELSTEQILGELTKHKKDTLLELSAKMNITTNKKLTKDALADKIFKLGFANRRGYDLLSGKGEP